MESSKAGMDTRVTGWQEAEASLLDTNAYLEKLYAHIPILVWDRQLSVIQVNRAFELLTGRKTHEVIGQALEELLSPATPKKSLELIRATLSGQQLESVEVHVEHGDGTLLTLLLNSATLYGPDSRSPLAVIAQGHDITDRKRMELELCENKEMLCCAEEMGHLGYWTYNLSTRRLVCSDGFYRIHQVARDSFEHTLQSLLHLTHAEDRDTHEAALETLRQRGTASYEYRILRRGGEIRHINGKGQMVYDFAGKPVSIFGTLLDVTELRNKEHELKAKHEELERITYTISHDLKSPLVTVSTFLEYLKQDLAASHQERIEKDIRFISAAADKMSRLLNELLELSRIGRMVNPPVLATYRELLDEALDSVAGPLAERGVEVERDGAELTLYGDRARLAEIWQNLLENAAKYMGNQVSPRVSLGAETTETGVIFWVRDNGMGIEPAHRGRIFRLFEKLDPNSQGTGLGLALVKRIVELYGGTIWVESEGPGQGSCFKFTLPEAIKHGEGKKQAPEERTTVIEGQ